MCCEWWVQRVNFGLLLFQAPTAPAKKPSQSGRNLNLTGHVGFDSLPDQLVNKSVAQGFCFNILCLGKKT